MVMELFLREQGFRVGVANSGEDALEVANDLDPQILVTDHLLGGIRGSELARRLHARSKSLRTFILTGLPPEDLNGDIEGLKDVRIFEKPVDLDVLHEAIAGVLSTA